MSTPAARCAVHGYAHSALTIEREAGMRGNHWVCYCPDCVDYDQDSEGNYTRLYAKGDGKTADEAFESYCDSADVDPSFILEPTEKHV